MTRLLRRRPISILIVLTVVLGGGLFWWTSRNESVAAVRPVYVALGASDAVGVGADHPASEGWVPLVAEGLPSHPNLVNLGISGATLNDVSSQELPIAVDAQPDWVTLWPGVNDLRHGVNLDEFIHELNAIVDQISQRTAARIILVNIPDLRSVPAFNSLNPIALDGTVREWNIAIADAARAHHATLVDLYANSAEVTGHPEDVSSDGFHPSTAGYKRIADLVLKTVHDHDSTTTP